MNSQQPTGAVLINQQTGQAIPLSRDLVTIGRKSDNTIVLSDDLEVSRHHATIAWVAGRYVINDAGSINGTFVNNQRLTKPKRLSNGDTIQIGGATFTVSLAADETKPNLALEMPAKDETLASVAAPPAPPQAKAAPVGNPYVGPRTFSRQEADRFFGREREARELFSLIISERLTLFYAQSGAGKSSLINARLIPQLQEADYAVLPVGRVGGELPEGVTEVDNIYIFNLLLSLDESDGDPRRFTAMSLSHFLTRLTSLDGTHYYYDESPAPEAANGDDFEESPYVLIIDQFEEIVTSHPARWQDREGFFRQLAQAMADDPMLWVALTLREDYVAALDPYIHLLPGNLRARFYMQRMGYEAALEAVQKPAERYGRPFGPGVAESLVDNLRQIRVSGSPGHVTLETQLGQFVEPVQLQVVCYQLWENLKERPPGPITLQDLQELGNVDQALAQFYEQAIAEVVSQTKVAEIELRNWFEAQLITEAGTKGIVYRGATHTGGIPNRAVELLSAKFLLRSEGRSGGTWYELVHDRFIEPILQSNQQWREKQPLLQVARNWDLAGRPDSMLLEGQPLEEALRGNWRGLGQLVREFLEASQSTQKARKEAEQQEKLKQAQALAEERQRRLEAQTEAATRLRRRARIIGLMGGIAVVLAFVAGLFGWQAVQSAQEAFNAQRTSEAERAAAATSAALAQIREAEARAAQEEAEAGRAAAAANANVAQTLIAEQNVILTAIAEATPPEAGTPVPDYQATIESQNVALTAIAATLTAVPPTPTDTATPIGGQFTPEAATATPTPPDTPTPTPTVTPTPSSDSAIAIQQSGCVFKPAEELGRIYSTYEGKLGCPVQQAIRGQFAEQPFENGYMIWSGILEQFYVMIGEERGPWYWFDRKDVESFGAVNGEVACRPPAPVPDGRYQPISGFGGIWCANRDIQEQVGWGTAKEFAVLDNVLQPFETGFLLRDSRGFVYVLFWAQGGQGGNYERSPR